MDSGDVLIGERLQELRGPVVSQAGLAQAMKERGHEKWSQATVWAVEQGKRPLRLSEAASIAAILHSDVEDLLVSKAAGQAMLPARESLFHLKEQEDRLAAAIVDFELSRYSLLLGIRHAERKWMDGLGPNDTDRVKELHSEARARASTSAEDLVARVKPSVVRQASENGIDL